MQTETHTETARADHLPEYQSFTITVIYTDVVRNGSASMHRSGRTLTRCIHTRSSVDAVAQVVAELASWTDDVRVHGIDSIVVRDDLAERVDDEAAGLQPAEHREHAIRLTYEYWRARSGSGFTFRATRYADRAVLVEVSTAYGQDDDPFQAPARFWDEVAKVAPDHDGHLYSSRS